MYRIVLISLLCILSSCESSSDFEKSSLLLNKFVLKVNEEWGNSIDFKKDSSYPYIYINEKSLKNDSLYFLDSRRKLRVDSSLNDLMDSIFSSGITEIGFYKKDKIEFIISKTSTILGENRKSYLFLRNQSELNLIGCEKEQLSSNWYLINCKKSF